MDEHFFYMTSWKYYSDLLEIETTLAEIATALPEIETACCEARFILGHNLDYWQGGLDLRQVRTFKELQKYISASMGLSDVLFIYLAFLFISVRRS